MNKPANYDVHFNPKRLPDKAVPGRKLKKMRWDALDQAELAGDGALERVMNAQVKGMRKDHKGRKPRIKSGAPQAPAYTPLRHR